MNYYEHHLGDFMRDTAHLTMVEECAYRRLLDAYYIRERALPGDLRECCKLARATAKPERDAVAYVLREFFELREDGYHQGRADKEIARFQDKQRKAKASAEARWSQYGRNANASPADMRTHSERNADGMHRAPVPRHQTPDTNNPPTPRKRGDSPPLAPERPEAVQPDTWADWLALRKAKKAPVTGTVLREAAREADKAGMPLEAFLRVWCSRGTQGLQADWLKPHERPGGLFETPRQRAARERMEQIAPTAAAKRPGAQTAEIIDVATRRLG